MNLYIGNDGDPSSHPHSPWGDPEMADRAGDEDPFTESGNTYERRRGVPSGELAMLSAAEFGAAVDADPFADINSPFGDPEMVNRDPGEVPF